MKPRHMRMAIALGVLAGVAAIAALVFNAFRSNMVFYFSPSQVASRQAPEGRAFRLGGMVESGSLRRDGTTVNFVVTDFVQKVPVQYVGILPDLFKEGKGVVTQGSWNGKVFTATEVLAKHDENYMPPEAAEALKQAQQGGSMPAAGGAR